MRLTIISLALFAVLLSGCSSSNSSNTGNVVQPNSPGEAEKMLNPADQASLETWKKQLSKTCDANEVFGNTTQDTRKLDVKSFLERNHHSLVVSNRGTFAILDNANHPIDEETTTLDESSTISNQRNYHLNAETHMSGGICSLKIFGQTVYTTELVQNFTIVAAYNPSAPTPSAATLATQLSPSSNDQSAELLQDGFGQAVQNALTPDKNTQRFLATQLGLSEQSGESFFQLPDQVSLNAVLALEDLASTTPFGMYGGLLGKKTDIAGIISGRGPNNEALTVRIFPPQFRSNADSSVTNSGDSSLIHLKFDVEVKSSNTSGDFDYTVKALTFSGTTPFDDGRAVSCFLKRLGYLKEASPNNSGKFSPSFVDSEHPCDLLAADFGSAFISSSQAVQELETRFGSVTGSPRNDYMGWDGALRSLVVRIVGQSGDVQTVLDPLKISPIIDQISKNAKMMVSTINDSAQNLSNNGSQLLNMVTDWSLQGQTVSPDQFKNILETLNISFNPFYGSTRSLMDSLSSDPNSKTNQDLLKFIQTTVNQDYKDAALAFSSSAQGLGVDDFVSDRFNSVIQNKTPLQQFVTWKTELDAAQAFATRDRARKSPEEMLFESYLKDLISRALQENWTAADYANIEAIAPISKNDTFCSNTTSITGLMNCKNNSAVYSKQNGHFLDPQFGDRYARASSVFQGALQELSNGVSFFNDIDFVRSSFFGPIWSACSNSVFDSNLAQFQSLVSSLANSTSDWEKLIQLDGQMRNLVNSNCNEGFGK